MRDITSKINTLRYAKAIAVLLCSPETVERIKNRTVPKGDVFEMSKVAGFLGAKQTSALIPHCHPIGIDYMNITFEYLNTEIHKDVIDPYLLNKSGVVLTAEAKCIGRTGIEIEALTGVNIAALTLYDTLKPIDTNLEITSVKLLQKRGGKSDKKYFNTPPTCAVLVCSDSTAEGKREDNSGRVICEMLREHGIKEIDYKIVPDEPAIIQTTIKEWVADDVAYIFTTGGTGLGPRDRTVEAVMGILERDANGIVEAIRKHGQERTPLAMMSRAVAGSIAYTTIVTLPGSSNGAREGMEAILPHIFHARKMLKGGGH